MERRKFLGITTTAIAGFGAVLASIPFLSAWKIRKGRFHDFDIEVDISDLLIGAQKRVEWMGRPVLIFRRSESQISELHTLSEYLTDPISDHSEQPEGTNNLHRSIRTDIMVLMPLCTHLGCESPKYDEGSPDWMGDEWKGGFFCPCHGSRFDLAGRVYKGVPAPYNMEIPPYKFAGENTIVIGREHHS